MHPATRRAPLALALLATGAVACGLLLTLAACGPEAKPEAKRRINRSFDPAPLEGPAAFVPVPGQSLLARFLGAVPPDAERTARVFTPLAEECTGACPPELHVTGGDAGAKAAFEALDGIAGLVEGLAAAPGMDPGLSRALRAALDRLERAANGELDHPMRVLFMSGRIPGLASAYHSTGVAFYDRADPFLDTDKPHFATGARLIVNRIEGDPSAESGPSKIVRGIVDVAGEGVRGRGAGDEVGLVTSMKMPIGSHFRPDPARGAGAGLGPDGAIVVYGVGETHTTLPPSPKLTAAFLALLRRP